MTLSAALDAERRGLGADALARMRRDLNPHRAARAAMWLWSAEYAKKGLGSMGFWDSLDKHRKQLARDCVTDIMKARP